MKKRDTRFTAEVLQEAGRRLNAAKDVAQDDGSRGGGLFAALGWAQFSMNELAKHEVSTIDSLNLRARESELYVSFWDGLLLGAIAADITYERSFGLGAETPPC